MLTITNLITNLFMENIFSLCNNHLLRISLPTLVPLWVIDLLLTHHKTVTALFSSNNLMILPYLILIIHSLVSSCCFLHFRWKQNCSAETMVEERSAFIWASGGTTDINIIHKYRIEESIHRLVIIPSISMHSTIPINLLCKPPCHGERRSGPHHFSLLGRRCWWWWDDGVA